MSKKDGGPAFPATSNENTSNLACWQVEGGMSLRDWFAGLAMQAMIEKMPLLKLQDPNNVCPDVPMVTSEMGKEIREGVGYVAYKYADAMLIERDK